MTKEKTIEERGKRLERRVNHDEWATLSLVIILTGFMIFGWICIDLDGSTDSVISDLKDRGYLVEECEEWETETFAAGCDTVGICMVGKTSEWDMSSVVIRGQKVDRVHIWNDTSCIKWHYVLRIPKEDLN